MHDDLFHTLQEAPADPILGVSERFARDTRAEKVNLGVGAYLDANGNPTTLDVVRQEETALAGTPGGSRHYYGPMSGDAALRCAVQELLFGPESEIIRSKRAATVQTLGGTGALRLAGDLLASRLSCTVGATSNPTWDNHNALFAASGLKVLRYRYYKPEIGIDFEGLIEDLQRLPEKSVTLLHACCHNPTGYDLNCDQWHEVLEVCRKKHLIALLDIAYQGFGDGLAEDTYAVRLFARSGLNFFVSSSFSKNFGLYGERIGALTVVTQNEKESHAVLTQAENLVRCSYSNPPLHGARIVRNILTDPVKKAAWENEVTGMRQRIRTMRVTLARAMKEIGAKRDFSFIARQKGMFSYTGFTSEQIERLAGEFGIYAVQNGRICLCGLNDTNIAYVARAFAAVL